MAIQRAYLIHTKGIYYEAQGIVKIKNEDQVGLYTPDGLIVVRSIALLNK